MQLEQEVPSAEQGAAVITAIWGERGAHHGWPHTLLKADRVTGHCPRMANFLWAETSSEIALRPSPASLPWAVEKPGTEKKKGLWLLLFRPLEWKKASCWWELLGFRATGKPCKFQKNHGCTRLQLFSCWHPEQTSLLRSWAFSPECFRGPASDHRSSLQSLNYKRRRHFTLKEMRKDHSHPHQLQPVLSALISISKSVQFAAA